MKLKKQPKYKIIKVESPYGGISYSIQQRIDYAGFLGRSYSDWVLMYSNLPSIEVCETYIRGYEQSLIPNKEEVVKEIY